MSGPSRLAFTMPKDQSDLPYTLAGVLAAMRTWPQSLDVGALPDPDPEGSEVTLGRGRLNEVLGSRSARQSIATLAAALEDAGAEGVREAIVGAGERVADRAAGALTGGASRLFAETTMRLMQAELDGLQDRFSALRSGPAHEAGIAALALAAGSSLADLAGRLRRDVDLIHEVPYLPLLLAPHPPADTATALELPYRVLLSPIEDARWQHRDDPVAHRSRTELWHTRLRISDGDKGADGVSKVRALWSPDYPYPADHLDVIDNEANPRPFRMSLKAADRQSLVRLTAGYNEWATGGTRFTPRSSRARRLHLSSLGSLTEIEGAWDVLPDGVKLEQWRHLASLGRDAYVRVVYRGFLLPFGHNASLIRVTERKFESLDRDRDHRLAVLRQRYFIIVRRRIVDYSGESHVHDGRGFPFTRIEILTRITPDLKDPGVDKSMLVADGSDQIYGPVNPKVDIVADDAFWPMTAAASGDASDLPFEVMATDIAGARVAFSMPLLFVSTNANEYRFAEVRRAYDRKDVAERRRADLGGATICYALFEPGDKGDPLLPTATMTFAAGKVKKLGVTRPNFYPETDAAHVGIKPIQKLLGQPGAVVDVAYPSVFKEDGFAGKNRGGLFLHLIDHEHTLAFGGGGAAKTDAIGGLAAPGMSILGLSKLMGPVSGQPPADMNDRTQVEHQLDSVIRGTFNPADFFKGAKILGGVDLAELLGTVPGLTDAKVPKLLARELPPGAPDRVEASFDWETEVDQSDKDKLVIPRANRNQPTKLHMHGLVTTPLKDPTAATSTATAELTNFKVNLFGFIVLWFDELRFAASAGQKPDVTVGIHPGDQPGEEGVAFGGPLEFVNELRKFVPANGFSDPPSLSVTPSGIAASYSLNLPVIGVGIFALKGASLGAGFSLPFDATPVSVRFNFSERQHPFSLTVSMLGGGGFFALTVSSHGVQEIEAALEFGAATSINLGVASGGVEIKAGVYFHWKQVSEKGSVELAGYVRLHGELCVVGLISASLTFNLQLAYLKENGTSSVWGEATLTVEVEIVFVSFDVAVKCRREFAGGQADPKFIELIPDEPTWAEYCDAFAVEG